MLFATATVYGVANSQAAADTLVGLSLAPGRQRRQGAFVQPRASGGRRHRFRPSEVFRQAVQPWALLRSEAEHSESKAAATKTTKPAEDEPVEDELAAAHAWV